MAEGAAPNTPEEEDDLKTIRVILSLDRLGELVGTVANHFAHLRAIDPLDFDSDEGREESRRLAVAAWHHVCHMADRAQFQASVAADLLELGEAPEPEAAG